MWRAAGDEEVHGNDALGAIVLLGVARIDAARDRAGTDRDDDFWRGNGVVRLLHGQAHIRGDRAHENETVGMAWGGDVLNAEAADVPADRAEDVDVGRASVAIPAPHASQFHLPSDH